MKLPPQGDTLGRLLYHVCRFFFPEPNGGTQPLTQVERLAALELRRAKPYRDIEGKEHVAAYHVFRAGEIIREHNARLNFDQHAAARARVPVRPLHSLTWLDQKQGLLHENRHDEQTGRR